MQGQLLCADGHVGGAACEGLIILDAHLCAHPHFLNVHLNQAVNLDKLFTTCLHQIHSAITVPLLHPACCAIQEGCQCSCKTMVAVFMSR